MYIYIIFIKYIYIYHIYIYIKNNVCETSNKVTYIFHANTFRNCIPSLVCVSVCVSVCLCVCVCVCVKDIYYMYVYYK